MTSGPRVPLLTLSIRTSTKGQPELDEKGCEEASLDIFLGLPLTSRPPVRLAWSVSSG